ncbi:hypothetical protein SKAU_G00098860 [Synaphobranchus kaupii]|uniref:Uncharacterized protein n=1 Tax=Synaphobranchus kaupii TaxID=118154 RepID=A0A9Q1J788_SYNKA|nr:hypothetical protein SKAU_G00098860 [Synaphobranchus kaupii]
MEAAAVGEHSCSALHPYSANTTISFNNSKAQELQRKDTSRYVCPWVKFGHGRLPVRNTERTSSTSIPDVIHKLPNRSFASAESVMLEIPTRDLRHNSGGVLVLWPSCLQVIGSAAARWLF